MAMRIKRLKSSTFGVSATDSTTSATLVPRQLGYEASTDSLVFNNASSDASEGGTTSDLVKFKATKVVTLDGSSDSAVGWYKIATVTNTGAEATFAASVVFLVNGMYTALTGTDSDTEYQGSGLLSLDVKGVSGELDSDASSLGILSGDLDAANFCCVLSESSCTLYYNKLFSTGSVRFTVLDEGSAYESEYSCDYSTEYYGEEEPEDAIYAIVRNVASEYSAPDKRIFGLTIDLSDSNPATCCTYTNDAAGFSAASGNDGSYIAGSLDSCYPWNSIKPCLLKNGAVVGYLNPNNYAEFEDGTAADITSGDAGDVMIEIPKFYYSITKTGTTISVKVSQVKFDGSTDYAFSYNGVVKDKFYVGAYQGYVSSGCLRSVSGVTPTSSLSLTTARGYAQANGSGYEVLPYNKWVALQVLYVLQFCNLNSQSALGYGYGSNSNLTTGSTDAYGLNYGKASEGSYVKMLGIENPWGNKYYWVDGILLGGGTATLKISDGDFNDTATGYTDAYTYDSTGSVNGYVSDVTGDSISGFSPLTLSGSSSTYFSDYGYLPSRVSSTYFGVRVGDYHSGAAGVFDFDASDAPSDSDSNAAARVAFCG